MNWIRMIQILMLSGGLWACSHISSQNDPICNYAGRTPQSNKSCKAALAAPVQAGSVHYRGVTFQLSELSLAPFIKMVPHPKLAAGYSAQSPIVTDLDSKWDLRKFKVARAPLVLGSVKDSTAFSHRSDLKILDMPIKMKGSNEYRLPAELAQFESVIQQIIDHEHAMLGEDVLKKYHSYITIDQGWVEPNTMQRKPGNHVDGFQGARIVEKNEINHSYLVMDQTPTVFYPQPFDFSKLDEKVHDYFKEMDRQGDDEKSIEAPLNSIVLMDAYTVHRAALTPKRVYRTFFRLSFDVKEFDRLGNTRNPHFNYNWQMQARDAHSQLIEYKPIEQCLACGMCPRERALKAAGAALLPNLNISISETLLSALIYELRVDSKNSALIDAIELRRSEIVAESASKHTGNNVTQIDLGKSVVSVLIDKFRSDADSVRRAADGAFAYLNLKESSVVEPIEQGRYANANFTEGYAQKVKDIDVNAVSWLGVDEYVRDRLGPLAGVIQSLGPQDRIVFSNTAFEESPPIAGLAVRLNLPLASYEKEILMVSESGRRTLVIADLGGKSYFNHFQLLIKRFISRRPSPRIQNFEAPFAYQHRYHSLADFGERNTVSLKNVDSIVFGYAPEFKSLWAGQFKKEIGTFQNGWKAEIYEVAGKTVAVFSTSLPMHGEILAENFKNLLAKFPNIKRIFAAGSAGALGVASPYRVLMPSRLRSPNGAQVKNILGDDFDLNSSHISVDSPLEETPSFLQGQNTSGAISVDMELGRLAELARNSNVEIGVGAIVTDLPAFPAAYPSVNLTNKNAAGLLVARSYYARSVNKVLESNRPSLQNPIEQARGLSFAAISSENLARIRREVGNLTRDEDMLAKRIAALKPKFIARVSRARWENILRSQMFLSTHHVAEGLGRAVSPTTPQNEQQVYGAYNYIFGTVGFDAGDSRYGEVALEIAPTAWQRRGWISTYSAWWATRRVVRKTGQEIVDAKTNRIMTPEGVRATQLEFAKMVILPVDLPAAMSLLAIQHLRGKSAQIRAEFLRARDEANLIALINEYDLVRFEGRIADFVPLRDISLYRTQNIK